MKISVDDIELFTISDIQKQVLCNDIPDDQFEDNIKESLQWIVTHKYQEGLEALKQEWIPKLKVNGVTSIPLDDDAFAQLVFAQPNYMNRSQRDAATQGV